MNSRIDVSGRKLGAIASAWKTFEERTRIGVIQSRAEYDNMVSLLNALIDKVGDDEEHPLAGLMDVVATLVEKYEQESTLLPDASPREVLKFLMEQHDLRQSDLKQELGSQGIVSEILGGKRQINARQARALGTRFKVSPSVFL